MSKNAKKDEKSVQNVAVSAKKPEETRIVYMDVADLKAYEKNPRKNGPAVEKVAASIREFGFKVPVVLDLFGGSGPSRRWRRSRTAASPTSWNMTRSSWTSSSAAGRNSRAARRNLSGNAKRHDATYRDTTRQQNEVNRPRPCPRPFLLGKLLAWKMRRTQRTRRTRTR